MTGITFDRRSFFIDGQRRYFSSGEIHYFRVPAADWRRRMRLLKETGARSLATYIPWLIHEPTEGRFRIDVGDGVTDLRRFLDVALAEGLYVIARPGPYQYSELVYAGLPGWLVRDYPQYAARNRRGDIFCSYAMSYLHPGFLEKVRRYFARICPILAEYSVNRGGPVAMVQPDNEAGGIHIWSGDLDFHPVTMGFGEVAGRYASFLKKRFENVDRLNGIYQTTHKDFHSFGPGDEPSSGGAKWCWNRDYLDFYAQTIGEYLQTLLTMMAEFGVDVPACHNAAGPQMISWFRESAGLLGQRMVIGADHYYALDQNWAQNNPTPQYAMNCLLSSKIMQLMGYPFNVPEFPVGMPSDWPPMTPRDLEAALKWHVALGMRAHNGYVFTGGPNVPDTGVTGSVYDYNAPISADGEVRSTYDTLHSFGQWMEKHIDWIDSESRPDFQMHLPWPILRAGSNWGVSVDPRQADPSALREESRRGWLTTSVVAGFDFSLIDPEVSDPDPDLPLVVVSDGTMPRIVQQRLVTFLDRGGRLLMTPALPVLDENHQPCDLLLRALGGASAAAGQQVIRDQVLLTIDGVPDVWANGKSLFTTATIPQGAKIIGHDRLSGRTVAWEWERPAGGQVMFLGLSWIHAVNEHTRMFRSLLRRMGVLPCIECDNSWIFLRLRWVGDEPVFFAANLGSSPQTARVRIRANPSSDWLEPVTLSLAAMEVVQVPFTLEEMAHASGAIEGAECQ